jgi:hypothetical protein
MATTDLAAALRQEFSGQVLRPAESGYDEARQVFNAMIDRRPAATASPG